MPPIWKTHMETSKTRFHLFLTIFIIGVLSGLTLTVLSTWADLESAYYGFARRAGAGLKGLSCPVLMTTGETNAIALKVTNTEDRKLSPAIRMEISSPAIAFLYSDYVELQAGESAVKEWEIGPDNVDLKRFIFAKTLVYASYPIPDREATCGVFIVDLPGTGIVYTWALVIFSLLGMGIGLYGLSRIPGSEGNGAELAGQLLFLAVVVIMGLITVSMGWWIQGVLVIVVALLFSVIISGLIINRSK
jgi:hypothetical protein